MTWFIQWSSPAFRELERLSPNLAFDIIRKTDLLATFPEMGPELESRFERLSGLRQLIINRRWRIVYEIDEKASNVWILAVQNCRQQLPPARTLKRRRRLE